MHTTDTQRQMHTTIGHMKVCVCVCETLARHTNAHSIECIKFSHEMKTNQFEVAHLS